ncbi:phragmoplast orienting kinesin [Trifolium repens]|nr:phragmoplast orienting kinesin [Trifolium repens]
MSAHANSTQDLRINLRFCRVKRVYSLVDENKAIAMEARQESESSKLFAEQKEEEVKILEHMLRNLNLP